MTTTPQNAPNHGESPLVSVWMPTQPAQTASINARALSVEPSEPPTLCESRDIHSIRRASQGLCLSPGTFGTLIDSDSVQAKRGRLLLPQEG
jgi:hypothetical protein